MKDDSRLACERCGWEGLATQLELKEVKSPPILSVPTYTLEKHCPKCGSIEDIFNPDQDPHLGCYSYPNCDIDASGCTVLNGDDAEPYGHRD